MAIKFTAESFLEIVKRSRLVSQDQLQRILAEAKSAGVDTDDSRVIADTLVEKSGLTRWQADKLLQGKHKGFFLGKYRLLSLLGKGGMGSVYLAEHTLMRRRCAIKVLPAKRVNDTSYLGRFHREAQAVAALDHVNIVRAYDVDKEDEGDTEIHFLVMEFVDGRSLLEMVQQDGPMDYVRAADYIRQGSDGLTHAHNAGMVHRDIKPGNLLVDESNVVKILDLGLARFFGGQHADEEESLTVAHDEKVLGTADYLAPEQALDSHTVDARADIYSLGCTFYFLLTGHPPFTEGTLAQRLMAHQTRQPPPLEAECPGIPVDLLAIINRMMAKSLDERFQSAAEVNDALKSWLLQNAGDDWRIRNSAIIGSDSSTSHGQAAKSFQNMRDSAAATADSNGEGAAAGPTSDSATATPPPLPPLDVKVESEDGDLAAFLSNLETPDAAINKSPDVLPAIDTRPGDSGKSNGAGSGAEQQPAAATAAATAAASPAPVQAVPVAATAAPAEVRPAQSAPAVARPVVAQPAPPPRGREVTVPVAEAVPVAAETISPPERSYARRTKKRRSGRSNADMFQPLIDLSKKKPVRIGAAAAAGLVLLGAVIYAGVSFLGGDGEPRSKAGIDEKPTEDDGGDETTVDTKTPKRSTTIGSGTVEVGPAAQHKTIAAALKYALETYEPRSPLRSELVIQVAGGQYAERIEVDSRYPAGIRLVAKEGARPVLAPTGAAPIIKLDGVERFAIEGFDLNAEGKPTAIELSGYLTACRLKDLKLNGFTDTGVRANGAAGVGAYDQEVHLERLDFRASEPKSVGIKFQQGNTDTAHVKVADCRFYGPLSVGILFQNSPVNVAVRRSIFAELDTGIKFDGSNMRLKEITIGNCTFYRLDRGIVYTSMPSPTGSQGLTITRNLFSELKGLETVVENDFDSKTMYSMFSSVGNSTGWNWTTRPASETPAAGEFDIFSNAGQRGATIDFVSTETGSDRFLAPPAGAPWASGPPADSKADLKPYVGAVGP